MAQKYNFDKTIDVSYRKKNKNIYGLLGFIGALIILGVIFTIYLLPIFLPKDVLNVRWGLSADQVGKIEDALGNKVLMSTGGGQYDITIIYGEDAYGTTGTLGYNFKSDKLVAVTYHFEADTSEAQAAAFKEIEAALNARYGQAIESSDGLSDLSWESERTRITLSTGTADSQEAPGTPSHKLYVINIFFEPTETLKSELMKSVI